MSAVFRQNFMKNWYRLEVAPLIVIIGGALAGTTWYMSRLCRNVDAVWDRRSNPYPWQNVDQATNLKLYSVSKEFEKTYKRDRL